MKLIVAVDSRWGIGKRGDLLLSIPEDMQYYRATTRGKVVAMGYNTLVSLPGSRPQPGRLNIVLNNEEGCVVPGAVVCRSIEQLLELLGNFSPDDVFVIGGGSVYRQMIPYCETAHITKMRFDGEADTYIPNLDELDNWSAVEESERAEYEGIEYSFVIYRNSSPLPIPKAAGLSSDMSAYFRKKEPLEVTLPADEDRKGLLRAKLKAYFKPLADGFDSNDVDEFLSMSTRESFESYLIRTGRIARRQDVEELMREYKNGEGKAVTVDKDSWEKLFEA